MAENEPKFSSMRTFRKAFGKAVGARDDAIRLATTETSFLGRRAHAEAVPRLTEEINIVARRFPLQGPRKRG